MKKLVFFISIMLFVTCKSPVEPIGKNIEVLWKIYDDNPDFIDSRIFSGEGSIVSDENFFYFHNGMEDDNSRIYKISFDGKIVKVSDAIGRFEDSVLLEANDKLYVSLGKRRGIHCLDKNTLEVLWNTPSQRSSATLIANDALTLYEMTGYSVKAYDLNTGTELWETKEKVGISIKQIGIDDDRLYVSTIANREDGFLYYINKHNGEIQKKIILPFIEEYDAQFGGVYRAGTTVYKNSVIVGCNNWHVYSFDKETGEKKWEFIADAPLSVPITISDDILYTGTLNGSLYALDVNTGKMQWKHRTYGSFAEFPQLYKDKIAFCNGEFYTFNKSGNILEHLKWTESNPYYYNNIKVNSNGQMLVLAYQDEVGNDNDKSLFISIQLN